MGAGLGQELLLTCHDLAHTIEGLPQNPDPLSVKTGGHQRNILPTIWHPHLRTECQKPLPVI